MAIHPVLRLGDPRLLRVAEAVSEFDSEALHRLIADMFDTMHAEQGVGLAAPQIGINLRVVVFGFADNPRYPDCASVPRSVLINPVITPLSEATESSWEGCLSVPGMRGMVERYRDIRYTGYDAQGQCLEVDASGFHARVVQHECDHLDGILYPHRLQDSKLFGFTTELAKSGQL